MGDTAENLLYEALAAPGLKEGQEGARRRARD